MKAYCSIGEKKNSDSLSSSIVIMRRNKIFHNGTFGVRASMDVNNIMFEGNMVFENLWWGICVHNNSVGVYKYNEIYINKMGGIKVGRRSPGKTPCVVVNDVLYNNCGPAFDEGLRPFERASFPGELQKYFPETSRRGEDGSDLIESVPIVVLAEFGQNRCENNEYGEVSFKEAAKMSQCVLCFRCNMNVKRCTGCMTATCCDTKCQTLHSKENRYRCKAIGQRNTVEVSLSRARRSGADCLVPPPRDQNHFIAKIQTLEEGPLKDHIDLRRSVGHNPVTAQICSSAVNHSCFI